MANGTSLMNRRIRKILLVCNNYDYYSLEEDGHLDAKISQEYAELNLSNPPVFERVETTAEALEKEGTYDLVMTMYNAGEVDVFDFSRRMKAKAPSTPVVLLSSFSREVARRMRENDCSSIDFVFCWNSSTDLIIAIVKLIEDTLNAEHDILEEGVQAILLVEDSVRYYSTYLPLLYKLVLQQNIESLRDALNEKQQYMRKRARPKILMATNYTDAVALYRKYAGNILGVISDIGFVLNRGDAPETEKLDAGIDLCHLIRKDNPKMPFLLQSSQESMRSVAESLQAGFVVKKSKTLTHDVSEYIGREFAFGDFIVKDPETGEETARARDLYGLENVIRTITDEEYRAIIDRNYLSKWLLARGIFSVGNRLRPLDENTPDLRKFTIKAIHDYRLAQGQGVVARFDPSSYNNAIGFSKLGDGSLGGKARGLAFLNHILQQHDLYTRWEGVRLLIPRTLVITTEYFDRFILENGLQYVINADITDEEILSEFVSSTLPQELTDMLRVFIRHVRKPLAIRSSSKLEDSYYQPFAGVYSTYMIPHTENEDQQVRLLSKAIKSVYASVYFASSRGYITATGNVLSEEKMAILVQEICGNEDGGYWFPTLSGVARSLNFYPIGYEKPEEGVAKVAFGLGKAVVDGEEVLRFCPEYPKNILQTSTVDLTLRETQKVMYALNLLPDKFKTSVDDAVNLERIPIPECTRFKALNKVASTLDYQSQRMVDSPYAEGPKYVTFSHILKYGMFPLADILKTLLSICRDEMKCGVEIEFAADLSREEAVFNVLQIRPISVESSDTEVDWKSIDTSDPILYSESALGTGWIGGVQDVIYLKEKAFDVLKTREMAAQLTAMNAAMREQGRGYVLIGYGRWGSSIPSLGVPVKWSDISETKLLVECCLEHFRVDPSQGTHFFQNLTSFNAGYVNVNPYARRSDVFNPALLDALPALEETDYIRHVRLERPLTVCVDGRTSRALVKIAPGA
ncbi:MAG: phosphoenolpyruvate synthase [Bacteroidales bacterium]|nr:phosphoenolpyruvate synthase [Bacteroidales bacterium]